MESAPTIPKESAILLPITVMTVAVSIVSATSDTLNFFEYTPPAWVK